MTGFHDVRFPDAIARGATGGPEYSTDIITVASGFEQRNINWQASRARYDIGTGIRTREQMAEVIAFFRARKGRAYGFRFRDWTDFDAAGHRRWSRTPTRWSGNWCGAMRAARSRRPV